MTDARPPRCRPLPPHVVAAVRDRTPRVSEAELVDRLERALAELPGPERAALVAAVGYDEGAVGAAMEVELEPEQAQALADRALLRLRVALQDVDDDLEVRLDLDTDPDAGPDADPDAGPDADPDADGHPGR